MLEMFVKRAFVFVLAIKSVISTPLQFPILEDKLNCDTIPPNYHCRPELSQNWGQYSPWFSSPSEIPSGVPRQCKVTFAQVLSRHGSRYPTANIASNYSDTIQKIQDHVQHYGPEFAFLKEFRYNLGTEDLTEFGERELMNSGIDFFNRYQQLASITTPFIRASGDGRVLVSAQKWAYGYQLAKLSDHNTESSSSLPILVLNEGAGFNNTLNNDLCAPFKTGPFSHFAAPGQAKWAKTWVPSVQARLNTNLPGADLTEQETIWLMDMCPYETVATSDGIISPFCDLFTASDWENYNYYQTLNKYYGYGAGNPLGPTQGVGYVNELIARLTDTSVCDHTSVNHTLDDNPETFPFGRALYADFSHDNDMTEIFFAMGLYKSTGLLSNSTLETVDETKGYSAAYTVPFAARIYVEKLQCSDYPTEPMVRILVNNRVQPLETCGGDSFGRCTLSDFLDSLSFARKGGHWEKCSE